MRRYAVRVVVAILTFGLGVAFSLLIGLFKPHEIRVNETWSKRRPPCPKKLRVVRPAFLTIDSEASDPLKLIYLGESPDHRMKFLIENRRDQMVSGFSLKGNEIWGTTGQAGKTVFDWSSEDFLRPGESRLITTSARGAEALSLRVSAVTFQSGFTWINPRDIR